MLNTVNGFELISLYYFQMPFMLQPKYVDRLEKNSKSLIKNLGFCMVAGSLLNVQVKRLYMNFLKWPFYARLPVRFAIMAAPFAIVSNTLTSKMDDLMEVML